MGQLVKAGYSCGYSQNAMVGGLRRSFLSMCFFPFLCHDCDDIFNGDLYEYRNQCRTCSGSNVVSYEDPVLFQSQEQLQSAASTDVTTMLALPPDYFPPVSLIERARRFLMRQERVSSEGYAVHLVDKGYYCPKCREHSLCFEFTGMVD
jgi:RNA polymerase subunit RPABC4/transcription elongation factor Spt4